MSIRDKPLLFVILVAGAAMIWLAMRSEQSQPSAKPHDTLSTIGLRNTNYSTIPEAHAAEEENPEMKTIEPAKPASVDDLDADIFVQQVINNPGRPIKPSLIPKLSDDQVDRLTREYFKHSTPTEKHGIVWALGFSQNDRAFDTLRYSLVEEYAGKNLTRKDNAVQMAVVDRIGILARHSDHAWNFLTLMSDKENWIGFEPWSDDYMTDQYKSETASRAHVLSSLQGSVFGALGMSGRSEFDIWSSRLMEIEPTDFQKGAAVFIEHSVFRQRQIRTYGYDYLYDEILYDIRGGSSAYVIWSRTPEGRKWGAWRDAQWQSLHGADSNTQPAR